MKILSMDMGGTFVKWAYLDWNNSKIKILEKGKYRTSENKHPQAKEVIWNMAKFANVFNKTHDKNISCVCASMAGIIDTDRYVVLSPNHTLKNYKGLHLQTEFKKYCNLPFYPMNDAKAAACGELAHGCLKDVKNPNAVLIVIGTGIGSCPIFHGKVYSGSLYASGEIGQIIVNGKEFENYYGVPALIERCQKIDKSIVTGEQCLELAKTNNKIELVVDHWFDGLMHGFSNYIYLLNPSYLVFGGKITEHKSFDLNKLKKIMLTRHARKPLSSFQHVKFVKAKLGNDAAIYGCVEFAKNKF